MNNVISHAIDEHSALLASMHALSGHIAEAAKILITSLRNGGRIYLCGNGGSAADSQHLAAELIGRFKRERRALPAIALNTDTSGDLHLR